IGLRPAAPTPFFGAFSVRLVPCELVHALVRQSEQSGRITGAHLQASSAQDTHGSSSRLGGAPFFRWPSCGALYTYEPPALRSQATSLRRRSSRGARRRRTAPSLRRCDGERLRLPERYSTVATTSTTSS